MEERNQNILPEELSNTLPPLPTVSELEELENAQRLTIPKSKIPYSLFGGLAADYCKGLAEAYQVHTDLIASCMLVAVGAAAGKKAIIKYGAYTNNPCLWLCVVARKGYNKTAPLSRVLAPLKQINEDLINYHIKEHRQWLADGGEKSGKEAPPRRKLLITDSTPEERYALLANNDLLYFRDELFGSLKDIGRYSSSGEVESFLSLWSAEEFSIDRKTSGSFYVKCPFMSWVGTIQKDLVQDAFGSMALRGNGFTDRWLFTWIENDQVSEDVEERQLPIDLVNKWDAHIQDIWHMNNKTFVLADSAKEIYKNYQRHAHRLQNDERCSSDLIGHFAKMDYYGLRLSVCIHLLKYGREAPDIIEASTMEAAVQTCHAFDYMNWRTLQRITGEEQRQALTDADLIRELVKRYNITNQSALARLVGRTQQYISKIINK